MNKDWLKFIFLKKKFKIDAKNNKINSKKKINK